MKWISGDISAPRIHKNIPEILTLKYADIKGQKGPTRYAVANREKKKLLGRFCPPTPEAQVIEILSTT